MPGDLSYLFPMYPILGGIACLLCFIPIPWHWKAGNIAVTALGLWILSMNIIFWVGTIVWHNTIANPNPIWGDIVNYFMVMWPTATASTSLCIQYRLWQVTRARSVFISKKEVCSRSDSGIVTTWLTPDQKRRRRYTTWALCLGLPILIMPIRQNSPLIYVRYS
jgi:pheromone a factor receptor